jgi:hypothetical protein
MERGTAVQLVVALRATLLAAAEPALIGGALPRLAKPVAEVR